MYPAIDGETVSFVRVFGKESSRIYTYDIGSQRERLVSPGFDFQTLPVLSGQRLAWMDDRHGVRDIYLMDLTTGKERRITTDFVDHLSLASSGMRLVWRQLTGGLELLDEGSQAELPARLEGVTDRFVHRVGQQLTVHFRGTDPEGGPVTFDAAHPSGAALSTRGATMRTVLLGDVNEDGTVDGADHTRLLAALGSTQGESGYDSLADFDDNGVVDSVDQTTLNEYTGSGTAPPPLGLLQWTAPSTVVEGREVFILSASDGSGQRTRRGMLVQWNHVPQFVPLADLTVAVGEQVNLFVRATDADSYDRVRSITASLQGGTR